ncbi:cytochrome C oxidase subunit IV family protein [Candidatus Methylomirabilis sp.]|uniref:Cytochrome C oxidase subunit IV family protein n=1 Tax=Candidatus Methylomirabilis tolerans TaxID=3123416 RepID=A0AAJ1EJX6_9BACT|nr:cytochrome C oxidase subunit IV family protein [Candidatus Methylomirabilis sp.]
MTTERVHPNYVAIWVWLVVLMVAGLLATHLPLGKPAINNLIFAIATVKAVLVALNYMHLKSENWLIYALAIVPVLLVVAMTLVLFPDIVFHH